MEPFSDVLKMGSITAFLEGRPKMLGNSISEKIRNLIMLAFCLVLVYTATAYAFNRILGSNIIPGDGLIFRGSADGKDSVQVLIGYGQYLDGDTVKWNLTDWDDSVVTIHSAQTISGAKTFSALISGSAGLTVSSGTVDLTGATVNLGTGAVQTLEIEDGTILFGDFNSATMDTIHDSHFEWKKSTEAAGAYRDGTPINFKEGSNVTITITDHAGDSSTVEIASTGGATWPGWHESGSANTIDTLIFLEGWGITITTIAGDGDTLKVEIDTATVKGLMVQQTSFDLHFVSLSAGSDDSIEVITPLSVKFGNLTYPDIVRVINTSGQDAQLCTLVYAGHVPWEWRSDLDSMSFPLRTATTLITDAYYKLNLFAMTTNGGFSDADTNKYTGSQLASSSGGVFRHVAVAGGSIGAVGPGAMIFALVECMVDAGNDTVDAGGVIRVYGDASYARPN